MRYGAQTPFSQPGISGSVGTRKGKRIRGQRREQMPNDPYGIEGTSIHNIEGTALEWNEELQEYVMRIPDDDSE